MRVLHIGKFFAPFAGGIENFMLDLLRACAAEGVVQACLVHEAPGQGAAASDLGFDFLERFERVPTIAQVSYAPISPGFSRAMEHMLAEFRPDVLHLHLPNTSAFWALKSKRARAIPWLVQWQSDVVGPGLDVKLKLLYPFYRPFEQAVLKRAEAVIVATPPYLQSSHALRPWKNKCRVIPLGLDASRIDPPVLASEEWRFPDKLRLLAVGRLSRYKGFDVLIRAAARVPEVEVVIAGEGQQRRRLERLLRQQDGRAVGGRVRLLGAVDDAARNRLLGGCDVFCLPSINRGEAFGLSLVEAMAAGKPQIATSVPGSGMGWVVEDGRTGWMVAPGDVDELATCLRRLARERARVAAAGARSRERFEARFRIDAVARQFVEVYEAVVSQV